jgi:hypothetical protein
MNVEQRRILKEIVDERNHFAQESKREADRLSDKLYRKSCQSTEFGGDISLDEVEIARESLEEFSRVRSEAIEMMDKKIYELSCRWH